MSYLEFNKPELVNLEYSLARETIRTNRGGSFASTTIVGCNTRKYHGLLICPLEDEEHHVFLSSLDATLLQKEAAFELALHKYPGGQYEPKGHIYVCDFDTEPIPRVCFEMGEVLLYKEILLVQEEEKILVRYHLKRSSHPVRLRLRPLLAFRSIHELTRADNPHQTDYEEIEQGIKFSLYENYPPLYMQVSKEADFQNNASWYNNVEYPEEQKRGYEYHEDLYAPGQFEADLEEGDSIVFAAGLEESDPGFLVTQFEMEKNARIPRNSFENCLINSAQQFIVRKNDQTDIIAGYPWFGQWARDTFIALPGLTLAIGEINACRDVLYTMLRRMNGPLFSNIDTRTNSVFNSADAPLWFFWAVQQYHEYLTSSSEIWETFGSAFRQILGGFREGTSYDIKMNAQGLIQAGKEEGEALTWMDSVVEGKPVTPRHGMPVEINALWYNALCFSLQLAQENQDEAFLEEWAEWPERIREAFQENYWDPKRNYLADCILDDSKDWDIRPNQLFAVSLPHSPLEEPMMKGVMDVIEQELLTPKGLRTLSPRNPNYQGFYEGTVEERDQAYHQGTVWPWLLGHFCEAYLRLYGADGLEKVKSLYHSFEEDMRVHGIGSISEIYDGNPPHAPNGAISQAWSVSEVLRIKKMIEKHEKLDD